MRPGPPSTQAELAALHLALLAVPGVGTFKALGFERARGGVEHVAAADDPLGAAVRQRLPAARLSVARAVEAGLTVIPFEHPAYPLALKHEEVKGPPLVLFVAGRLPDALASPLSELRSCAIVGTRRASRFALELASDIASALAHHGVLVVSGLALGVDGAAHEGALAGAGAAGLAAGSAADGQGAAATVAVLGGGHRRLHPAQHHDLALRIVDQGGAVVSEWPPHASPAPHNFLRRNRIIAALARCTVIIEAGRRSGALNTASHAQEQGRDVMAVPGRPNDPRYAGTLALLHDGAGMVLDASDVLHQFGIAAERPEPGSPASGGRNRVPWTSPLPVSEEDDRAALVRRVLAGEDEVSLDGLIAAVTRAGADAPSPAGSGDVTASLTSLLTLMELAGEVERTDSGRYRLLTRDIPHGHW